MITCKDCRFWQPTLNDMGDCRRNPPVIVPSKLTEGLQDLGGYWPSTNDCDWCGKFGSKKTGRIATHEELVAEGYIVIENDE